MQSTEGVNGSNYTLGFFHFMKHFETLTTKLSLILPEANHRGLIFDITSPVKPKGKTQPATWVRIERGSKDWFIVDVDRMPGAIGAIHPVNFCVGHPDGKLYWSIINRVTSPNWFN